MPKSTRQLIVIKHDQIIGHLEKAIVYTDDLATKFQEHHPDYAVGYTNIVLGLYQILEFVKSMKKHI